MNNDEYREEFGISDRDLEDAMGRRSGFRRLTKEQQIYGVFNDSDAEEETTVSRKQKKSYTTPLSFVAGGVVQAGKKKEDLGEDEEAEMEEEEETIIHTLKGRKRTAARQTGKSKGEMGNWEAHTKGIGAKLLLQMGYQPGKGLGRELQGISKPIEAVLRKGRGAIGAYGTEVPIAPEPVPEEEKELKPHQWRSEGKKKNKANYVYKTIEEVIEEESKGGRRVVRTQVDNKVKVIDMTGPEQRVLSGYHAISSQAAVVDLTREFAHYDIPELRHNVTLFVDMCEHEIIRNARELNHAHDRIVGLEQEENTLKILVDREENQLKSSTRLLGILEDLENRFSDISNPLTLSYLASVLTQLQTEYYEEYHLYEMGNLANSYLVPLMRERLSLWQPLSSPKEHITLFQQFKDILENQTRLTQISPYYGLIWNAWMPLFRIAVSSWNCRICDPMIDFIEVWLPLLPPTIFQNILHHFILPKIQSEVDTWNPLTDTIPIHSWVHPWIPLLGQNLDIVYPTIRQKLGFALINWHPSDKSARLVLEPWLTVFPKAHMDAFLIKHIVPKLAKELNAMTINPQSQVLDQWNWVMAWEDLLPIVQVTTMLEKFFFPKWLQVLATWLNHNPNYEEVTNWYKGWKVLFPENIAKHPSVKEQLTKALDIMNRAVQMANEAPPRVQQPFIPFPTRPVLLPTPPPRINQPQIRVEMSIPSGFKDLVIRRCEERGILIMPVDRWQEGKQVYKCGSGFIYFDKNVIFAKDYGTRWIPISIQTLLETVGS
ncbi:tuftelin-interacting protein 11-like isoform X1 [Artemia franciscana]|uniref:G-patch domain-containing protein n=1 Tax=Artemia franciscana TaxID=6661 RepID=A0AA88I1R3_ARTSF|nr:hypothetical protein QYM36_009503 [Artemia franciscana]